MPRRHRRGRRSTCRSGGHPGGPSPPTGRRGDRFYRRCGSRPRTAVPRSTRTSMRGWSPAPSSYRGRHNPSVKRHCRQGGLQHCTARLYMKRLPHCIRLREAGCDQARSRWIVRPVEADRSDTIEPLVGRNESDHLLCHCRRRDVHPRQSDGPIRRMTSYSPGPMPGAYPIRPRLLMVIGSMVAATISTPSSSSYERSSGETSPRRFSGTTNLVTESPET